MARISKIPTSILPQSLEDCKNGNHSNYQEKRGEPRLYHQPPLFDAEFPLTSKRQKPQITSTPGVSPKERNRYRVVLGSQVLGDKLSLDEALSLAKRGAK